MQDSTYRCIRGFLQGTCVTVSPLLGKNLIFLLITIVSGYANLLLYTEECCVVSSLSYELGVCAKGGGSFIADRNLIWGSALVGSAAAAKDAW